MVVVSDPAMIQRIIGWQDEVQKSVDIFYSQFNIVRTRHPTHVPTVVLCMFCCLLGGKRGTPLAYLLQLARDGEVPNMFTSATDDWWRLIRKSLAPAFAASNLRHLPAGCAAQHCPSHSPGMAMLSTMARQVGQVSPRASTGPRREGPEKLANMS